MRLTLKIKRAIRRSPFFRRLFYSFYFRLILLDFKKNQLLVLIWLLFFALISNKVAPHYGVAYLFLGPEYYNKISLLSCFIIGFACGGFIMSYNIASFIKNAFRFPFLATLRNPFFRYCLNNFFTPLLFTVVYCFQIFYFLKGEGIFSLFQIFSMILAFIIGNLFFVFIAFTYFFGTNRYISKIYGIANSEPLTTTRAKAVNTSIHAISGERNPNLIKESRDWYVETYLVSPFKVRLVRSVRHYKKEVLKSILKQNHKAAFIFQLIVIISLICLGLFSDIDIINIPAGASLFLLFTMFITLFSSFYTWFRGWSTVVFIFFLLIFNFLHKVNFLSSSGKAYGLDYKAEKAHYTYYNFKKRDLAYDVLNADFKNTISILNKWKIKNTDFKLQDKKPKIVFINVSGGGVRSSLWVMHTLQTADSLLNGKLLRQTQMITGSSGGMIGAAYLRELYLLKEKSKIDSYYDIKYKTNISKDILNPIAFKIATTEWLFPFKTLKVDDNIYYQDRGYAFEQTLLENTGNVFNRRLSYYKLLESNSYIPMMVFSPSIVNDGRKMLISPVGVSYLTQNTQTNKINYNKLYDAIEYSRFFDKQDAHKTLFTSVLRMSATFPYISPVVSLPSEPRIEIMDAGLRDNYGLETTLRFIKMFNTWIAENTSGIVIIQIRDKRKNGPIEENPSQTFFQSLGRPMGSFYGNLFQVQDFNQNQQIQYADIWCKSKIDIVDLQLRNEKDDRISLSWHLTNNEKIKVLRSLYLPENQEAINKIVELLK